MKFVKDLDTPCLLIDLPKLTTAIDRVNAYVRRHGKRVRPHAKTHKCPDIAAKQLAAGACGICVTKLSEAEVFGSRNISPILITSPVVTAAKIHRLIALSKQCELAVVVDSKENAVQLDEEAGAQRTKLKVLLEIDGGQKRTGCKASEGLELAKLLGTLRNLHFAGIQCYLGHLQHVPSAKERKEKYLKSMQPAIDLFQQLKREDSLRIGSEFIFTGGGSGTLDFDMTIPELTDVQVGSYVCGDGEYGDIELSEQIGSSPALTLLTTVISTNQEDRVTIDAGLKANYHDGPPPRVISPKECIGMKYSHAGDEHGYLFYCETPTASGSMHSRNNRLCVGDVLEMIVGHCDPTVNLHNTFYVRDGEEVVAEWSICARGCCQ